MKKILSVFLALTMVLSLAVMFATNVAAAASDENMWTVLTHGNEYLWDYEGERTSVPGYYYDEEGFHTYGGEWKANTPYQHVQTNQKVNLKDGVYMEVRVDEFDYNSQDKWFNFNIWDSVGFEPGNLDERLGEGVQTLLRPSTSYDNDQPGYVNSVQWDIKQFTSGGANSYIREENRTYVEKDGRKLLTFALTITWDEASETFAVDINGASAPERTIQYMHEKFSDDSYAYIGFAMHSSTVGGSQSCTVTKFGTSREDATTPYGYDAKDPENYDNTPVDIMDPSNVLTGEPAIFMNGNVFASDVKYTPTSPVGSTIYVTDDEYVHIVSISSYAASQWMVDNTVSYAVEDFPYMMVLTKNLCTCKRGAYVDCFALESMKAYIMAGDVITADSKHGYSSIDMCYEPYIVYDDSYLTFTLDISETVESGRFNGVRLDVECIDLENAGFNEFDICFVGLFRNEEEAYAYVEEYLTKLGWGESEPDDPVEPDYPVEEPIIKDIYGTINEGEWLTTEAVDGADYYNYYYKFTPKYTGTYWFHNSNALFHVGYAFLDSNMNPIEQNYTSASSTAYLNAGKTYYIYACGYGDQINMMVEPLPQKTKFETEIFDGEKAYFEFNVPGDYYYLSFTPKSTGRYYMDIGSYGGEVDVVMFDEASGQIIRPCDFRTVDMYGWDFDLIAGNKYYLRVKFFDKSAIGGVSIKIARCESKEPTHFMTADADNSYLAYIEGRSAEAGDWFVTGDNTVKLIAKKTKADFGTWIPDNPINISDGGVIMCMTKNYCTCQMGSHEECFAFEEMYGYITIDGGESIKVYMDVCYDPYLIGGEQYLTFYFDLSEYQGNLDAIALEAVNIDLENSGFNEFELCWIGKFADHDQGEQYAAVYLFEHADFECEYLTVDFFTMEEGNDGYVYIDPNDPVEPDNDTEYPTGSEDTTTPEKEPGYEVEEIYDYIQLGDVKEVDISNGNKEYYFEFTPDRNGNYYFYSTGDYRVFGEILDEDGNILAEGESEDGLNFIIRYSFKKGETYYLHTGMADGDSGVYKIELQKKKPANSSSNNAEKKDEAEQAANTIFGCSMSAGFGGVAIVAVAFASAGFVSKRRRDEE